MKEMTEESKHVQQPKVTDTQTPEAKTPEQTPEVDKKEPTKEGQKVVTEKPKESESAKDKESDDVKVDVEELKRQLAEAIEQGKEVDALNTTVATMKSEVEKKDAIITEYETLLQNLINTKMEQVPEQYKDLVPDNMDIKQKLSWLEKAENKGLFNKEEKQKPTVEIGKPMNVEAPKPDVEKMSASTLLSMAYNTFKK